MATDEKAEKKLYANALLKNPNDSFKAAMTIVGGNHQRALMISHEWPQDPEVIEYCAQALAEKGEDAFLPSKYEVVHAIWNKAEKCHDIDAAFKGYKIVADIMGYVKKPSTTINNNNNTLVSQRSVMVVTDLGTDDVWEVKLKKQQADLTRDCSRAEVT